MSSGGRSRAESGIELTSNSGCGDQAELTQGVHHQPYCGRFHGAGERRGQFESEYAVARGIARYLQLALG